MNYELAKKLKDAGFPMKIAFGTIDLLPSDNPDYYNHVHSYLPTLSELIESCGTDFSELHKKHINPVFHMVTKHEFISEWYCTGGKDGELFSEGDTSEEAVANLWLKLHE